MAGGALGRELTRKVRAFAAEHSKATGCVRPQGSQEIRARLISVSGRMAQDADGECECARGKTGCQERITCMESCQRAFQCVRGGGGFKRAFLCAHKILILFQKGGIFLLLYKIQKS